LKANAMTNLELLNDVIAELAKLNASAFPELGAIPATLVIASRGRGLSVLPLEALDSPKVRATLTDAAFVLTVVEGYMIDQRVSRIHADELKDNPDSRLCLMYLAQARDGTRACAVQFILRPEHGKPALAPLKVINPDDVGFPGIDDCDDSNATRH
jgi:hypothetical protein